MCAGWRQSVGGSSAKKRGNRRAGGRLPLSHGPCGARGGETHSSAACDAGNNPRAAGLPPASTLAGISSVTPPQVHAVLGDGSTAVAFAQRAVAMELDALVPLLALIRSLLVAAAARSSGSSAGAVPLPLPPPPLDALLRVTSPAFSPRQQQHIGSKSQPSGTRGGGRGRQALPPQRASVAAAE